MSIWSTLAKLFKSKRNPNLVELQNKLNALQAEYAAETKVAQRKAIQRKINAVLKDIADLT